MPKLVFYIICWLSGFKAVANGVMDTTMVTIDFPQCSKENKFIQRLTYQIDRDTVVDIRLDAYCLLSGKEPIHLYDLVFEQIKLKAGLGYVDLPYSKADSLHKTQSDFFDVLQKFKMVPAGDYKTIVEIYTPHQPKQLLLRHVALQSVDSTLAFSSGLRTALNKAVEIPSYTALSNGLRSKHKHSDAVSDVQALNLEQRLSRKLRQYKGLVLRNVLVNGQYFTEAYYKNFFLGRYALAAITALHERGQKEAQQLSNNTASLVTNELDGFRSVGAQLKELNAQRKTATQMKGFVDVNTYTASTVDPQSSIDPNYTEVLANVDVDLMGFPVNLEGFYTSQDAHRQSKASYFRFHYDVQTAKDKLQKVISGYKSKLNETVAKGQGLENIYGNYAKGLDVQKNQLLQSLQKDYGIAPQNVLNSKGDLNKMFDSVSQKASSTLDTAMPNQSIAQKAATVQAEEQRINERKAKALQHKKDIEEKYKRIVALQQQALKYYQLLEQYKKQNYIDSALNYKKMVAIDENGDPSFKEMSKAAAGILPEGKLKKFTTGLTHLDAGIINKYESSYTMAGQNLKGMSMGYDLGICKTGITAGATEYANRTGGVDHYNTLLLSVNNKGAKQHKFGFLYNVITPSNSMQLDRNFIGDKGIQYPSFRTPTQIASIVYDGRFGKVLIAHSEWASSYKSGQTSIIDIAHAAFNQQLDVLIPKTSIAFKGAWEHLGAAFENNTLPYVRSGTERYTLGTNLDLFRSFLSLKLDYNMMLQQNFSSTGINKKWGFDVRTHSKRYPSLNLSYKPFSTFRSYADTFQVVHRPIQGAVWSLRANYQFKRLKQVHRFTMMYNRNTSSSDSAQYNSSTAQIAYVYTRPSLSLNVSVSRIELPVNFVDGTGVISSYITSVGFTSSVGKQLNVSIAPDISICTWGLQRIAATTGLNYKMNKLPLSFRIMLRYADYKLNQSTDPVRVYAGQLGMHWYFEGTSKKNNNLN